jgi:hypothetical protein
MRVVGVLDRRTAPYGHGSERRFYSETVPSRDREGAVGYTSGLRYHSLTVAARWWARSRAERRPLGAVFAE